MLSYPELNSKLNLCRDDYENIVRCTDTISKILDKYPYKMDTIHRDEIQTSKRDALKHKLYDFKTVLESMEEDC